MIQAEKLNEQELSEIIGGACTVGKAILYGIAGGLVGALGLTPISAAIGVAGGIEMCDLNNNKAE